jgi:RimJ/RimL family protein N-acetyltransferase
VATNPVPESDRLEGARAAIAEVVHRCPGVQPAEVVLAREALGPVPDDAPAGLVDFLVAATTATRLRNGSMLVVRPIAPWDKQALADGLEGLSPQSRFYRFFTGVDRLTERELRLFTEIDYVDHFAWGANVVEPSGLRGAGVARYIRLRDEPDTAEAAVTVVDEYHGQGIGTLLLTALVPVAASHGIRRFRFYTRVENRGMGQVLERLGTSTTAGEEPGVRRSDLELPATDEEDWRTSPLREALRAAASFGTD